MLVLSTYVFDTGHNSNKNTNNKATNGHQKATKVTMSPFQMFK